MKAAFSSSGPTDLRAAHVACHVVSHCPTEHWDPVML